MPRFLALILFTSFLASCAGTQGKIQTAIDRKMLSSTIGKSYAALAKKTKFTPGGFSGYDFVYGNFHSSKPLTNGAIMMRHIDRQDASEATFLPERAVSQTNKKVAYRIFYFNVGADGRVRDWAMGYTNDAIQKCTNYIGVITSQCDDVQNDLNFAHIDGLVTTSQGLPISSWQ